LVEHQACGFRSSVPDGTSKGVEHRWLSVDRQAARIGVE